MITKIRLVNFKSFREAELNLGPLTLLVGTNASGKSNLRDAFRFLHGIGRGYSLAEIIGAKYGEGGELQWRGIRGGTREIAFEGKSDFTLEIWTDSPEQPPHEYGISIDLEMFSTMPGVGSEKLYRGSYMLYDTSPDDDDWLDVPELVRSIDTVKIEVDGKLSSILYNHVQPILSQFERRYLHVSEDLFNDNLVKGVFDTANALRSMRFLDLNPNAMRDPSFPGQNVLGDHGENLSSVLQAICQNEQGKQTLLAWLQELTPMDAADFKFPPDQIGRVLLTLVEKNGRETTAYSASDGTLRFLAMIAALLGPETARLYFFEEIDAGIHPTRLHLLIQLIEQQVKKGKTQVVATTHSPSLLRLLSPESLENAAVVYRSPESPESHITRLLDLPDAQRLFREQDIGGLFESGWLENALAFQGNGAAVE